MLGAPAPVGIIANPASGKDIRRLVGHASVFDNNEKVQIVRRVLIALETAGVSRVLAMPDYFGIVERALAGLHAGLTVETVVIPRTAREDDTTAAAAAMAATGAAVIVTLGGDGTNRAAALGTCAVPFIPVSTGTNNVFPTMMEGTAAGLAAAALACGLVSPREDGIAPPSKCLRLLRTGAPATLALIDVAVLTPGFIGARAIWEPDRLQRVILTRSSAAYMGLAGLGGLLHEIDGAEDAGLDLAFGADGFVTLRAPLAPGLFSRVCVHACRRLTLPDTTMVEGPALIALDGERGLELPADEALAVTLERTGPPVVDVPRCLALAAGRGLLRER